MTTLYDSTFYSFYDKKESKFVIFKEKSQSDKNLLVHFLLLTRNIIIVFTVFTAVTA